MNAQNPWRVPRRGSTRLTAGGLHVARAAALLMVMAVVGWMAFPSRRISQLEDPPWRVPAGARPLSPLEMERVLGGNTTPKGDYYCASCTCSAGGSYGFEPTCSDGQQGAGTEAPSLNPGSGNLMDSISLGSVSAVGGGLDARLTYSLHIADGTNSPLNFTTGYGWITSYDMSLIEVGQDMALIKGDGHISYFDGSLAGFVAMPGEFAKLQRLGGGIHEITTTSATVHRFGPGLIGPWPGKRHLLTTMTDSNGRVTNFTYDGQNRLVSVMDHFGNALTFSYDPQSRLTTVTDPLGRITSLSYDAGPQVHSITKPDGTSISYLYDEANRLIRKTVRDACTAPSPCPCVPAPAPAAGDLDGNSWIDLGDVSLFIEALLDPAAYETSHPGCGLIAADMNGDGLVDGRDIQSFIQALIAGPPLEDPPGRAPCPVTEEYVIDYHPTSGRFAAMRDLHGVTVYNASSSNAWQVNTSMSLLTGQMRYLPGDATVTDANGSAWKYFYDDHGQITQIDSPLVSGQPAQRFYEYDAAARRVKKATDARGFISERTFDANGNVTQVKDPELNTTNMQYAHPIPALMTRKTEPDGDVWQWSYDANGNLLEETDPLAESPTDKTTTHSYDGLGRRIGTQDRDDHVTTYTYDGLSREQTQTVDPGGLGLLTQYQYDAVGNRTQTTDPRGIVTQYQYDDRNRMNRQTHDPGGLGLTTCYEYDGRGNRTKVTNPRCNSTRYEYDARDRLIRQIDAMGQTTTYTYDGASNRTSTTDVNLNVTTYQYDERNRLTRQVDDFGGAGDVNMTTRYEYDASNNRTRTTRDVDAGDGSSRVTAYQYDALNRQTRQIMDPGGLNLTTEYHYASSGCGCGGTPGSSLITCVIDPAGKVSRYHYDALDRRVKEIRQVGVQDCSRAETAADSITTTTYDPVGNVLQTMTQADPSPDLVTEYQYDAADRRIQQAVDPSGANLITDYQYDGNGNQIIETRPNCNAINHTYDNADRRTTTTDSNGPVITMMQYDANSNAISTIDGNGNTTSYTYDPLDRRTSMTDALGRTTTYQFDPVGNVLMTTDREGNVTTYQYDGVYRQIKEVRAATGSADPALNITTEYRYDDVGNLRELKAHNPTSDHPAEVQITEYQYDAANRRIREIYPDDEDGRPRDKLFVYDGVGNVTQRTDQNRDVTHYQYDDLHRLTMRSYTIDPGSPTYPTDQRPDTYSYDRASQMLSAVHQYAPPESDVTLTFTYDGVGRVVTLTQDTRTITYAYIINPLTNRREITYASGRIVREDYDKRDRLDRVTDQPSGALIADRDYDPGDRLIQQAYGNATTTTWTHNANNWTTRITHSNGGGSFIDLEYGHDNEGNPLYCKHDHALDTSELYAYDAADRLVDFHRGTLNGTNNGIVTYSPYANETQRQEWTLEPLGNWRVNQVRTNNVDVCEERFANKVNEYTSLEPGQACPPPGGLPVAMAHDDNGNMTDDPTGGPAGVGMHYEYDVENRLTQATRLSDGLVVGQYFYDAMGRRVRKVVTNSGPLDGTTVYLLNERWQTLAEYDAGGVLLREYTYGSYIDEPLTLDRNLNSDATAIGPGDQRLHYHGNMLYSTCGLTDSSAGLVEANRYDVYGRQTVLNDGNDLDGIVNFTNNDVVTIAGGSSLDNPHLFTSRVLDGELAAYYYRARWQNPHLGRFAQHDPLGHLEGIENLYTYVEGRATLSTDPTGEIPGGPYRDKPPPWFLPAPRLSGNTVVGPEMRFCGAFVWGITWTLDKPSKKGGYILQYVEGEFDITDCNDGRVPSYCGKWDYWEAWAVRPNSNVSHERHEGFRQFVNDAYTCPELTCSKATKAKIKGTAQFYEGLKLPAGFIVNNPNTDAGMLPSSTERDLVFSIPGDFRKTLEHSITVKWNCCPRASDRRRTELVEYILH